jgi:hypothetical protein
MERAPCFPCAIGGGDVFGDRVAKRHRGRIEARQPTRVFLIEVVGVIAFEAVIVDRDDLAVAHAAAAHALLDVVGAGFEVRIRIIGRVLACGGLRSEHRAGLEIFSAAGKSERASAA